LLPLACMSPVCDACRRAFVLHSIQYWVNGRGSDSTIDCLALPCYTTFESCVGYRMQAICRPDRAPTMNCISAPRILSLTLEWQRESGPSNGSFRRQCTYRYLLPHSAHNNRDEQISALMTCTEASPDAH
jgi:hypothetical protein